MIKPVSGVQSILPLIDHIVETKPHLPPLVIGLVSADASDARDFVEGYKDRLFDIRDLPLVPNAYTGSRALNIARAAGSQDVVLLDEIAKQLRESVPVGAGRGWRTKQFAVCMDVLRADGIDQTTAEATREALFESLYKSWEKRKKLLYWVSEMSTAELPSKIVGFVLSAVLRGPSRWWFGSRLNSRKFRWFSEHVARATGERGAFLNQASYLLPGNNDLPDVTALRRRILFDALLNDVALFVRRQRFLPHRRRRRWSFIQNPI